MRVKRTSYLFLFLHDGTFFDVAKMLRGTLEPVVNKTLTACCVLTGKERPIDINDVRALFEIPSTDWLDVDELVAATNLQRATLDAYAQDGIVVTDSPDPWLSELHQRHQRLRDDQWNIYSALLHFMTRWQDMHLQIDLPDNLEALGQLNSTNDDTYRQFIETYGSPPPHFHSVKHQGRTVLPQVEANGQLYDLLRMRKTTRAFDPNSTLAVDDLSVILHNVFGYHGYSPVYRDIVALKKTSPSGGCLHPTEVYTLVIRVEGMESGLYHYNVESHALDCIERLPLEAAVELANEFTAGQSFPRWSSVLFIMTARFYRNYWKYRRHDKAYRVLFMDAAHLSQTFYMVCAERGLGAFVTAAINNVNIEQRLGIDGFEEGAVAITGCGKPTQSHLKLEPDFIPGRPEDHNA